MFQAYKKMKKRCVWSTTIKKFNVWSSNVVSIQIIFVNYASRQTFGEEWSPFFYFLFLIIGRGGIWTTDISFGNNRRCQPIELQRSWQRMHLLLGIFNLTNDCPGFLKWKSKNSAWVEHNISDTHTSKIFSFWVSI